jgi:hypothetical protein
MAHSLVGLSDSKFDVDLVKKEIDHDFFDNPSISTCKPEASIPAAFEKASTEVSNGQCYAAKTGESNNRPGPSTQVLPNGRVDAAGDILNQPEGSTSSESTSAKLNPQIKVPLSLIFSQDLDSPNQETPVNCPAALHFGTIQQQNHCQQVFSTERLLECLPKPEDVRQIN